MDNMTDEQPPQPESDGVDNTASGEEETARLGTATVRERTLREETQLLESRVRDQTAREAAWALIYGQERRDLEEQLARLDAEERRVAALSAAQNQHAGASPPRDADSASSRGLGGTGVGGEGAVGVVGGGVIPPPNQAAVALPRPNPPPPNPADGAAAAAGTVPVGASPVAHDRGGAPAGGVPVTVGRSPGRTPSSLCNSRRNCGPKAWCWSVTATKPGSLSAR